MSGVLARRRWDADLRQGHVGAVGRYRALSVVAGRVAADAGLGPPVRGARRPRATDRGAPRLLRAAGGRLALLRAARPAGQGLLRAPPGLHGALVLARPGVRQ